MCGIVGIIQKTPINPALLDRMTDSMEHRGPDDRGTAIFSEGEWHIGLGHRRLSILDLSPAGRQPMQIDNDYITYNGEVYNYLQLREELSQRRCQFKSDTDTEVVLQGFREFGQKWLERMNGMFALGFWQNQTLTLVRDRFGQKPLYYMPLAEGIAFASELKALLLHPECSSSIDFSALQHYLAYEYLPAPMSIIRGVFKLPQGHKLIWKNGEYEITCWWTPNFMPVLEKISEAEAVEEINLLFGAAVKRRLMSDVPLGVFLSGGIDSTSIAAELSGELSGGRQKTFSIGFTDRSFDESGYASMAAEIYRTEHFQKQLTPQNMLEVMPRIFDKLDEPYADSSIIPTWLLSQFTREHVTVALGGDGGDELFAGYDPMLAHRLARVYEKIPRWVHQKVIRSIAAKLPVSTRNMSFDFRLKQFLKGTHQPPGIRNQLWLGAFNPDEQKAVLSPEIYRENCNPYSLIPQEDEVLYPDLTAYILAMYQKFYLADDILVKIDRASMMVSLEARSPFLDVELTEFVNRLPSNFKLKGLTRKHILKKALIGKVPYKILHRPKKGFGVPLSAWFRNELSTQLQDVLAADTIRKEGIFSPDTVQSLINQHLSGKKDNRKQLWTLFVFQQWKERFLPQGGTL
ncbi:MAG: asparagine synthase (glutamine-hydrolyzing) [Candidatus Cloacimonetes bacterium]|nr:asparagine synthase (glutamine-hydrolyzing) [Candidatus Cloacimonadota bacterium]